MHYFVVEINLMEIIAAISHPKILIRIYTDLSHPGIKVLAFLGVPSEPRGSLSGSRSS